MVALREFADWQVEEAPPEAGAPEAFVRLLRAASRARKHGDYSAALTKLDEARTLNPRSAVVQSNRSIALALQGRLNESLEAADEAVRLSPDSALAHYHRGAALGALGRADEAVSELNAAYALDSGLVDALALRSIVLDRAGRTDDALRQVNQALNVAPGNQALKALHEQILTKRLLQLVDEGVVIWNGEKFKPPAKRPSFGPGPSVSDIVIQMRRE